jgi:hypothetical protein
MPPTTEPDSPSKPESGVLPAGELSSPRYAEERERRQRDEEARPRRLLFLGVALALLVVLLGAAPFGLTALAARTSGPYVGKSAAANGLRRDSVGAELPAWKLRGVTQAEFHWKNLAFKERGSGEGTVLELREARLRGPLPGPWASFYRDGVLEAEKIYVSPDWAPEGPYDAALLPEAVRGQLARYRPESDRAGTTLVPALANVEWSPREEQFRAQMLLDVRSGRALGNVAFSGAEGIGFANLELVEPLSRLLERALAEAPGLQALGVGLPADFLAGRGAERKDFGAGASCAGGKVQLTSLLRVTGAGWTLDLEAPSNVSLDGAYELIGKLTLDAELSREIQQQVVTALRELADQVGGPATGDLEATAWMLLADQVVDRQWTQRFRLTGNLRETAPSTLELLPHQDAARLRAEQAAKIEAAR